MKTKIIAAVVFVLSLTTTSAFAGGYSSVEKSCPKILAGGGTYISFDVQRWARLTDLNVAGSRGAPG